MMTRTITTTFCTAALAFAGFAPSVAAQCTFQPGSIAAGSNVTYAVQSLPTGVGAGQTGIRFTADPNNDADIIRELTFMYRIAGDTRESAFNTGSGQCVSSSFSGASGSVDWTDVDNRGLLSASLGLQAQAFGPTAGCVTQTLTLTNTSSSAVTLDAFAYCDVDLCSNPTQNIGVIRNTAGTLHRITSLGCTGAATIEAVGADAWQATSTGAVRALLFDNAVTNLNNSGLSLFGDYSAGFQWRNRTIPAGQSLNFTLVLCHNPGQCGIPAASVNYGNPVAGSQGIATLTTTAPPQIDSTASLSIANGPPLSTGLMILGDRRTNLQVGGARFLTSFELFFPVELDIMGNGSLDITIPDGTTLCGTRATLQFVFVDPIVTGPLPIGSTDAVEWTLGS